MLTSLSHTFLQIRGILSRYDMLLDRHTVTAAGEQGDRHIYRVRAPPPEVDSHRPSRSLSLIASLIAAEPRQEALFVLLGPVQRMAHRQRLGDGHGHCRLGQRRPRTLPLQGQPTPYGVRQRRVERERVT